MQVGGFSQNTVQLELGSSEKYAQPHVRCKARVGIEHVDQRRFKTSSWQSCGSIHTHNESEAIAALDSCLAAHAGEYVRLFGIDSSKRRMMETIVQRPAH